MPLSWPFWASGFPFASCLSNVPSTFRPSPLVAARLLPSEERLTTVAADCEVKAACAFEDRLVPSEPRAAEPLPWVAVLAAGAIAGASVLDTTLMLLESAELLENFRFLPQGLIIKS